MNSWEQLTIYNENGEQERLTFEWPFAQFGQRYPPNNESGQMLRASLFLSLSLSYHEKHNRYGNANDTC